MKNKDGYLIGPWPATEKHYYKDLGDRIRRNHPKQIGEHVSIQVHSLGLSKIFETGTTVGMLPYSFTDGGEQC